MTLAVYSAQSLRYRPSCHAILVGDVAQTPCPPSSDDLNMELDNVFCTHNIMMEVVNLFN